MTVEEYLLRYLHLGFELAILIWLINIEYRMRLMKKILLELLLGPTDDK